MFVLLFNILSCRFFGYTLLRIFGTAKLVCDEVSLTEKAIVAFQQLFSAILTFEKRYSIIASIQRIIQQIIALITGMLQRDGKSNQRKQ